MNHSISALKVEYDLRSLIYTTKHLFARYSGYAKKKSDEMLNAKHARSHFERECDALGKVDGIYLLRKPVGAMIPLLGMVSW